MLTRGARSKLPYALPFTRKKEHSKTAPLAPASVPVPMNDDELWSVTRLVTGLSIPRTQVCPDHCAPFTAFADAFFARHSFIAWKGSRGFGGKTTLLAALSAVEGAVLGAKVSVLGGSGEQSTRVHAATDGFWYHPEAPQGLLDGEPTKRKTSFATGGAMVVLTASQKSVRGPHPQRLRLDEVDEMDLKIFKSSLGQPMAARGIKTQIVASSTHQYPNGTMSYILQWTKEIGAPVYQWCWRESSAADGWLDPEEVEAKRRVIPKAMWDTEYELQEPSIEGRAIDQDAVLAMFVGAILSEPGDVGIEFEQPVAGARYCSGADWGKRKDYCVFVTFKIEGESLRLVAYRRMRRKPWPILIDAFDKQRAKYKGPACHDATGIGGVIDDYHDGGNIEAVYMTGRPRAELFNEYILSIEHGKIKSPRIPTLEHAHKYVTNDDLFGRGHPPDEIVACCMARKASKLPKPIDFSKFSGISLGKAGIGATMPNSRR